jgi:hypothetical protein
MVQIPSNIKTIALSPQERGAILNHSKYIERYYYDLVLNSSNGVIPLHEPDYLQFRAQIGQEIEAANNPQIGDIFGHLYNRLSLNPVSKRLAEELSGRDYSTIEEYQHEASRIMTEHNTRPDPEMGGLSPVQVSALMYSDWESEICPLKLNHNLSIDELKDVPLFHNARLLLNTLIEMQGEPTATEKCGLLNRKITSRLIDGLMLGKIDQVMLPILKQKSNTDEESLKTLRILRVVCQCADLIHLRKNQYLVKKKYQYLLLHENAGKLYHQLFTAYLRKYNMGYGDRLGGLDGIQATIGYILYRIQKTLNEFTSVSTIIDRVFLPALKKQLDSLPKFVKKEFAVRIRLLEPLEELGIIECRWEEVDKMPQIKEVRKTQLLDRFISFKF